MEDESGQVRPPMNAKAHNERLINRNPAMSRRYRSKDCAGGPEERKAQD